MWHYIAEFLSIVGIEFGLRNLFRKRENTMAGTPGDPQVRQLLRDIVAELPEVQWIMLMTRRGRILATYIVPQAGKPTIDEARIVAMSVAMAAVGERMCKELQHGPYESALITGKAGSSLVLAVNDGHILGVGLGQGVAFDAVWQRLGQVVPRLEMARFKPSILS